MNINRHLNFAIGRHKAHVSGKVYTALREKNA